MEDRHNLQALPQRRAHEIQSAHGTDRGDIPQDIHPSAEGDGEGRDHRKERPLHQTEVRGILSLREGFQPSAHPQKSCRMGPQEYVLQHGRVR